MLNISDILTLERTHMGALGQSKKRIIQTISSLIAQNCSELEENYVFDQLIARERLGSTGFGKGVAIPHCRLATCNSVTASFFKLEQPIEFDAIDAKPVDLLFVLLVPEEATNEHLNVLANLAQLFDNDEVLSQLRQCQDEKQLFEQVLTSSQGITA